MNANDDTSIHKELLALANQSPNKNAYALSRPDTQKIIREIIAEIRRIDPDWNPKFRGSGKANTDCSHSKAKRADIQLGDSIRNWVWFDYIPYSERKARTARTDLRIDFLGRHRHGCSQPIESGYPRFPEAMYDSTKTNGARFRLKISGTDDVCFLLQHKVFELSFKRFQGSK